MLMELPEKKYTIAIEETVCKEFEVMAKSEQEARQIAERKYFSGEFVVDEYNVSDKQIRAWSDSEKDTDWYPF